MDDRDVSRRLKAARWIAGSQDEKGRVTSLTPEELAQKSELVENGITANAITEFERLIRRARPMELRAISAALDLPVWWFSDEQPDDQQQVIVAEDPRLEELVRELTDYLKIQADLHAAKIIGRIDKLDRRLNQLTQLDDTTVVPLVRRALEVVADEAASDGAQPQGRPRRHQGTGRAKTQPGAKRDPGERLR